MSSVEKSIEMERLTIAMEWGVSLVAQIARDRGSTLGREDPLEEDMATHSSILVWKIPGTEEPGGLQSMGSQRIGHD